jgi:hypothetical protein
MQKFLALFSHLNKAEENTEKGSPAPTNLLLVRTYTVTLPLAVGACVGTAQHTDGQIDMHLDGPGIRPGYDAVEYR